MVAAPMPVVPYPAQALPVPGPGPLTPPAPSTPELTEFTLLPSAPPRQVGLRHANPLCRLAAQAAACGGVCESGCGIADPLADERATCPLGLELRRVGPGRNGGVAWAGRRFGSAGALHAALDTLTELGLDEATLLAHLPPNPIVFEAELAAEIERLRRGGPAAEPAVVVPTAPDAAPIPPAAPQPGVSAQLGNLLEYFAQVHALLQGGGSAEARCERFLHAVAGLVPFQNLELFLPDAAGAGLVIAATVQGQGPAALHQQVCRLSSGDLGLEAFGRGVVLAHDEDETRQFTPNCTHAAPPAMLALPLPGGAALHGGAKPPREAACRGVWLASRPTPHATVLGAEWFRAMTLLARLLAGALQTSGGEAEAGPEPRSANRPSVPAEPTYTNPEPRSANPEPHNDALAHEIIRATRMGTELTLVRLSLHARRPGPLPALQAESLRAGLAGMLRPYDALAPVAASPEGWQWEVTLPGVDEATAMQIAERLLEALQDALDAQGGMEELGLAVAAGVAQWGPTAPDAAHLRAQAQAALAAARGPAAPPAPAAALASAPEAPAAEPALAPTAPAGTPPKRPARQVRPR